MANPLGKQSPYMSQLLAMAQQPTGNGFQTLIPVENAMPIASANPAPDVAPKLGLPPKPPGQTLSSTSVTYKQPMDDQARYDQEFQDLMTQRQDDRAKVQAERDAYAANEPDWLQKANLAPLLSWADSMSGNKTALSYDAPTIEKDRQAQLNQYDQRLMKSSDDISGDQLGFLKNKADMAMQIKRDEKMMAHNNARDARFDQSQETKIRNEWQNHPINKASIKLDQHFSGIDSNDATTPAGQMAIVFGFMKMLDEDSVVRESEYAQAAKTTGVYGQLQNLGAKIQSGEMLNPSQVRQFQEQARRVMREVKDKQAIHNQTYEQLAMRKGYDPQNVVLDNTFGNRAKALGGAPSADDKELKRKRLAELEALEKGG